MPKDKVKEKRTSCCNKKIHYYSGMNRIRYHSIDGEDNCEECMLKKCSMCGDVENDEDVKLFRCMYGYCIKCTCYDCWKTYVVCNGCNEWIFDEKSSDNLHCKYHFKDQFFCEDCRAKDNETEIK